MQILHQSSQLVITLSPEEDGIVTWIMQQHNGEHIFHHVLNELLNQRKVQMEHDEKEEVWQAHKEKKYGNNSSS